MIRNCILWYFVILPVIISKIFELDTIKLVLADLCGRAVYGVGLRPLACWDCGFESRRGMDVCLCLVLCFVS